MWWLRARLTLGQLAVSNQTLENSSVPCALALRNQVGDSSCSWHGGHRPSPGGSLLGEKDGEQEGQRESLAEEARGGEWRERWGKESQGEEEGRENSRVKT